MTLSVSLRFAPCLAVVAAMAACGRESPPPPGLSLIIDGTAIRGTYVHDAAVVRFDAHELADGDGAQLDLDIDGTPLELTLDRSGQRFVEDAHGSTFTLADRALLVALRDAIGEAHPEVIETLAGSLLVRAADRYSEVPVGRARYRLDVSLAGADGPAAKADVVQYGCGDDGTNCFSGTYGQAWAVFTGAGGVCQAESAYYGDSVCRGRCGAGCSWWDEDYTWDCYDHDVCLDYYSSCDAEWDDATDDWAVTWGYWCTSGSTRSKPPTVPVCGNAVVETGEACDDGNTAGGDGCGPTCQVEPVQPAFEIRIDVEVDGLSRLVLKGDTAQWHHLQWVAPGRFGGVSTATQINGVDWFPTWPDVPTAENLHCNCLSDVFAGIAPAIPQAAQVVIVESIQARGPVRVIQAPSEANAYTAIIELDDTVPPGPARYIVDVGFASLARP